MIRYVFREGPLTFKASNKADPQAIGQTLASIASIAGGRLEPADVVDAARDETSPLHPHFEWDDGIAAEAWRLDQARALIRVVSIKDKSAESGAAPAFLSVADKGGTAYRTVQEVRGSAELTEIVRQQAVRDLDAWTRRYHQLTAACAHVEKAKAALQKRQANTESRAAA